MKRYLQAYGSTSKAHANEREVFSRDDTCAFMEVNRELNILKGVRGFTLIYLMQN